jgi:hypothetical protein
VLSVDATLVAPIHTTLKLTHDSAQQTPYDATQCVALYATLIITLGSTKQPALEAT